MQSDYQDNHAERGEDDSPEFVFEIPFQAPVCGDCNEPAPAGRCETCGSQVSADPHIAARQKALARAEQRARSLLTNFDQIPSGSMPLTPDQFGAALNESELADKVASLYSLGGQLGELDLANPRAIGSDARRIIEERLDHVEGILGVCLELAWFRPLSPADHLQDVSKRIGRHGAELLLSMIEVFRSTSIPEAEKLRDETESLWSDFSLRDEFDDAMNELELWREPDLNARIELAIGRPGSFTDESSALDPSLVLLAFSQDREPYSALTKATQAYFAHLLETRKLDDSAGAVLAGPLVLMAASEKPLLAHRTARAMFETLTAAFEKDPSALETVAKRSASEGPTVFAALARVERAFRSIREGSSDEDVVDRVLSVYKQLAETGYRMIAWLVLGAESILAEKPLEDASQPPMLGELQQQLSAGGPLGRLVAMSIDTKLRNAEAHAQYRWIPERGVVRDWRTSDEWTVDQLRDAIDELMASINGGDVAFACFALSSEFSEEAPGWLFGGEVVEGYELLANITFGGRGLQLVEVKDRGETVVIRPPADNDPNVILPALAGLVNFVPHAKVLRVCDSEGKMLVDIDPESMRNALAGSETFRDLWTLATAYESAVRTGMDPARAGTEFVALATKLIAVTGVQELVDRELSPVAFRSLNDRLAWLAAKLRRSSPLQIENSAAKAKQVGRLRGITTAASRGDQKALRKLMDQLGRFEDEAIEIAPAWPPRGHTAD